MLQPTSTPDQAVSADSIVKNPTIADDFYGYLLVSDMSTMGTYSNLTKALNLLDTRGWNFLSMVTDGTRLMVLLHRDKQKREAD